MQFTITLDDPDTIALLRDYQQFIEQHDGASGTVDQAAEGLILMFLDGHPTFTQWRRSARTGRDQVVVPLPEPALRPSVQSSWSTRSGLVGSADPAITHNLRASL